MKALSFKQPWAWAILFAGKRIENRVRKDGYRPSYCSHRGPLVIHASAHETARFYDESAAWIFGRVGIEVPAQNSRLMQRGAFIGVCEVIGDVNPDGGRTGAAVDLRWHMKGSYGLVLSEDVAPIDAFPFKGMLGLYDVPAEVEEAASRALGRAKVRCHGCGRPPASVDDFDAFRLREVHSCHAGCRCHRVCWGVASRGCRDLAVRKAGGA